MVKAKTSKKGVFVFYIEIERKKTVYRKKDRKERKIKRYKDGKREREKDKKKGEK